MTYSVFYYAPVLKTNSVYIFTGKQDDKVMAYVGKTDTDTIIRMRQHLDATSEKY